jgi:outer membrane protein assembly factor BamA
LARNGPKPGRHIAVIERVSVRALYLVFCLAVAASRASAAQEPARPAQPAQGEQNDNDRGWMAMAERWFDPGDGEVPRFTIVFGGIKAGSGAAAGPAVAHTFGDGSFVQARAEYSIHSYKLLQAQYQSRVFEWMHAAVSSRVRWQDAPSVALYELGAESSDRRALYAERKTEYSAQVTLRPTSLTHVAGGLGYERYRVGNGRIDEEEDEHLTVVPPLPGLGARPAFLHTFAAAAIDTRPTGDVSRSGWRVEAAAHHFTDRDHGTYSFSQFVGEAERLVPVARERGALALVGTLWASNGTTVPFFLMPTLGGGDYLRGYRTYRFRDRDALVLTAQFQWRVHEWVDAVAFVDDGRVAPRLSALRLGASRPTEGIGVRVRAPKKTIFRFDVARSVEGLQWLVGFSSRASAVF